MPKPEEISLALQQGTPNLLSLLAEATDEEIASGIAKYKNVEVENEKIQNLIDDTLTFTEFLSNFVTTENLENLLDSKGKTTDTQKTNSVSQIATAPLILNVSSAEGDSKSVAPQLEVKTIADRADSKQANSPTFLKSQHIAPWNEKFSQALLHLVISHVKANPEAFEDKLAKKLIHQLLAQNSLNAIAEAGETLLARCEELLIQDKNAKIEHNIALALTCFVVADNPDHSRLKVICYARLLKIIREEFLSTLAGVNSIKDFSEKFSSEQLKELLDEGSPLIIELTAQASSSGSCAAELGELYYQFFEKEISEDPTKDPTKILTQSLHYFIQAIIKEPPNLNAIVRIFELDAELSLKFPHNVNFIKPILPFVQALDILYNGVKNKNQTEEELIASNLKDESWQKKINSLEKSFGVLEKTKEERAADAKGIIRNEPAVELFVKIIREHNFPNPEPHINWVIDACWRHLDSLKNTNSLFPLQAFVDLIHDKFFADEKTTTPLAHITPQRVIQMLQNDDVFTKLSQSLTTEQPKQLFAYYLQHCASEFPNPLPKIISALVNLPINEWESLMSHVGNDKEIQPILGELYFLRWTSLRENELVAFTKNFPLLEKAASYNNIRAIKILVAESKSDKSLILKKWIENNKILLNTYIDKFWRYCEENNFIEAIKLAVDINIALEKKEEKYKNYTEFILQFYNNPVENELVKLLVTTILSLSTLDDEHEPSNYHQWAIDDAFNKLLELANKSPPSPYNVEQIAKLLEQKHQNITLEKIEKLFEIRSIRLELPLTRRITIMHNLLAQNRSSTFNDLLKDCIPSENADEALKVAFNDLLLSYLDKNMETVLDKDFSFDELLDRFPQENVPIFIQSLHTLPEHPPKIRSWCFVYITRHLLNATDNDCEKYLQSYFSATATPTSGVDAGDQKREKKIDSTVSLEKILLRETELRANLGGNITEPLSKAIITSACDSFVNLFKCEMNLSHRFKLLEQAKTTLLTQAADFQQPERTKKLYTILHEQYQAALKLVEIEYDIIATHRKNKTLSNAEIFNQFYKNAIVEIHCKIGEAIFKHPSDEVTIDKLDPLVRRLEQLDDRFTEATFADALQAVTKNLGELGKKLELYFKGVEEVAPTESPSQQIKITPLKL